MPNRYQKKLLDKSIPLSVAPTWSDEAKNPFAELSCIKEFARIIIHFPEILRATANFISVYSKGSWVIPKKPLKNKKSVKKLNFAMQQMRLTML